MDGNPPKEAESLHSTGNIMITSCYSVFDIFIRSITCSDNILILLCTHIFDEKITCSLNFIWNNFKKIFIMYFKYIKTLLKGFGKWWNWKYIHCSVNYFIIVQK